MSEFTPQSPIRRANVRLGDSPAPNRGRDPFVARVGALVLVALLAIPVVAALNNDGGSPIDNQATGGAAVLYTPTGSDGSIALVDPAETTLPAAAPASADTTAAPTAQGGAIVLADPSTTATTPAPAATAAPAVAAPTTAAPAAQRAADSAIAATEAPTTAATTTTTTAPPCSGMYEIGAGDYWIGIAGRAGVSTAELLAANGASSGTPIYPGSSICLPVGAVQPGPPPTTAAPTTTTKAPTTTATPTTTTVKPTTTTTTAAPTTTAPPPPKTYTADEVKAIIAQVFPPELVDDAIKIAYRESNLKPGVRNSCCFGLFQINWSSHKSWLGWLGITTPEQLYDPTLNAQAAYALYQRSGGWGPWGGVPS